MTASLLRAHTLRRTPVPAVVITDRGVEIDHLASVDLHPAAELFPPLTAEQYAALYEDIRDNDLQQPIPMTPDGQLIDGRSRWRICRELGITPITRVERGNPYRVVLLANKERVSKGVSALAVARMPNRRKAFRLPEHLRPLRKDEAALLVGVGSTIATRDALTVIRGAPEVATAVEDGLITIGTGYRIARDRPMEEQVEIIQRIRGGEGTRLALRPKPAPVAHRDNRRPDRHSIVTVPVIENSINHLDAVGLVIDGSPEGLDPGITSEEAGQLLARLSKAHRSYGRLTSLLRERKDSTQ